MYVCVHVCIELCELYTLSHIHIYTNTQPTTHTHTYTHKGSKDEPSSLPAAAEQSFDLFAGIFFSVSSFLTFTANLSLLSFTCELPSFSCTHPVTYFAIEFVFFSSPSGVVEEDPNLDDDILSNSIFVTPEADWEVEKPGNKVENQSEITFQITSGFPSDDEQHDRSGNKEEVHNLFDNIFPSFSSFTFSLYGWIDREIYRDR